jgi:hypothetical protein
MGAVMTMLDGKKLKHGLYVLHWAEGGHSLAAVGSDAAGQRWYAPINWISGICFDWTKVESVTLLVDQADLEARKDGDLIEEDA